MGRQRRDHLQTAHYYVVTWSEWLDRHIESSAIGYPSSTAEARAGEGGGSGKACSRCPDVMMPGHVAIVDRAVRIMPDELSVVLIRKYRQNDKVSRRKLDEALTWLAGRLHV
jgi:hypothetical protein